MPAGSGAGSRREKQSHKVATRSRRLACLSRVNIGPRLHTVMTNRGGRAQKRDQDGYLVLTEPTHAIPVIFLPPLSSKNQRRAAALKRRRRGGLGARLLALVPASFVKAAPSRLSSKTWGRTGGRRCCRPSRAAADRRDETNQSSGGAA